MIHRILLPHNYWGIQTLLFDTYRLSDIGKPSVFGPYYEALPMTVSSSSGVLNDLRKHRQCRQISSSVMFNVVGMPENRHSENYNHIILILFDVFCHVVKSDFSHMQPFDHSTRDIRKHQESHQTSMLRPSVPPSESPTYGKTGDLTKTRTGVQDFLTRSFTRCNQIFHTRTGTYQLMLREQNLLLEYLKRLL